MSFFGDLMKGESKALSEERRMEDHYEKIFKKISRDFVTKEDLKEILLDLMERLMSADNDLYEAFSDESIMTENEDGALKKVSEYKANQSRPIFMRRNYKDTGE